MAGAEEPVDSKETAALMWLIVAMVIGIVLYLSYYFANAGKKKKESKIYMV